ncbi:MAG: hypothetical protein MK212_13085 [Saprospiraceae bacterium]|nr:hypothetical protein [Saprospiraceae bacterium]
MNPLHLNIHHAIQNRLLLEFNYADEGTRVVEPFCFGLTRAGNLGLRAYQLGGYTNTSKPDWKLFDLAKAKDIKVLAKKFEPSVRTDYSVGDKHMKTIYIQVY